MAELVVDLTNSSDVIKCSSSSSTQSMQGMLRRINVPGDGSCLFWAVTLAYLLPVKNHYQLFHKRFKRLFGEKELDRITHVRNMLKNYDPKFTVVNPIHDDNKCKMLVTKTLRYRVVRELMARAETFKNTITIDDFHNMRNDEFITGGKFAENFQQHFPNEIAEFNINLRALKPAELNAETINEINHEIGKIGLSNDSEVQKFKFKSYLESLNSSRSWGGDHEIQALQSMLKCTITVFINDTAHVSSSENCDGEIIVFNDNQIHYQYAAINARTFTENVKHFKGEILECPPKISFDEVNHRDERGWTLLHHAVRHNNDHLIRALMNQGAFTDVKNNCGKTPFGIANIHARNIIVYELMQSARPKTSQLNRKIIDNNMKSHVKSAWRNYHSGVKLNVTEDAKYIMLHWADVNTRNNSKSTVLVLEPTEAGQKPIAYKIQKKPDLDASDNTQLTPLRYAVNSNKWHMVKYLVENEADLNVADEHGVTPLMHAITLGYWNIAKLLVEYGAVIANISEDQQRDLLAYVIDKETDTYKQFAAVICLNNVKLLEILISYLKLESESEKLEQYIAKVYESLKFRNITLSPEMELFVESKIIESRLINRKNDPKVELVLEENHVKKRVSLVVDYIDQILKQYLDNGKEIDEEFLVLSTFIAQNMHALKRSLKSTYCRLPWEEMQFYLVLYVISSKNHIDADIIYKLVLDKKRLMKYLKCFNIELEKFSKNFNESDIIKKPTQKDGENKLLSVREKNVKNVVELNPKFNKLYADYEVLKDVYSLKRIQFYVNMACSVELGNRSIISKLVIERALQVMGECLKSSEESPNLSEAVNKMLMNSAPENLKEIITTLRDSLSHAHSLTNKMEIENKDDLDFFYSIRDDLSKIKFEITKILYYKKRDAVKTFLQKIVKCKNIERFNELAAIISDVSRLSLEEETERNVNSYELLKVKTLIQDFQNSVANKNEKQIEAFKEIDDILKARENKIEDVKSSFVREFLTLAERINNMQNNSNPRVFQNMSSDILSAMTVQSDDNRDKLQDILPKLSTIIMASENRSYRMCDIYQQILYTSRFEADRLQTIDQFTRVLENKEANLADSEEEIEKILNEVLIELISNIDNISSVKFREEFDKLVRSKKKINRATNSILKFFSKKQQQSTSKLIDKAQYDRLIKKIQLTPKLEKQLRVESCYQETDFEKYKPLINKLQQIDSYGKLVKNVEKNKGNVFSIEKISVALKEFLKSLNLKGKMNEAVDSCVQKNKNQLRVYFAKRTAVLGQILSAYKNDLDLLTNYRQNSELKSAIEMLVLDLTEFLETISKSLKDVSKFYENNQSFLDQCCPVLIGKNLRNYLAHGDLLIHALHLDPAISIIYHANFFKTNVELDQKDWLIGQRVNESVEALARRNNDILQIIKHKNETFSAATENNIDKIKDTLRNYSSAVKIRDIDGWSLLHFASKGDSVNVFQFLLDQHLSIKIKNKQGQKSQNIAAAFGSQKIISYLIETDKYETLDVNKADENGITLLHTAAQHGQTHMIAFLLENGAYVDAATNKFETPLHYASKYGHNASIVTLLAKDAFINADAEFDWTPLHYAAAYGHAIAATTLLNNNAFINARTFNGWSPMHYAAINGHLQVVEVLISHEINIDLETKLGETPLHFAAKLGHVNVVSTLLEKRADYSKKLKSGWGALDLAILNGHREVALLLLNKNLNISVPDKYGILPIHVAVDKGFTDIVEDLLNTKGVDVNRAVNEGCTPLHFASFKGFQNIVKLLLDKDADTDKVADDGYAAIHLAAINGHYDVIQMLLDKGVNVNSEENRGKTPLHLAAESGYTKTIELLIKNKAKVNAANQLKGVGTPLHLAVFGCHNTKAIEILIINRASVNATAANDETPLHLAAQFGRNDVIIMLLNNGAEIEAKTTDGWTSLHLAAQRGHENLVETLINKGADVNAETETKITPLHLAAENGHANIIKLLFSKNALLDAVDDNGWTPLHHAGSEGQKDAVELLLALNANASAKSVNNYTPFEELLCTSSTRNETQQVPSDKTRRLRYDLTAVMLLSKIDLKCIEPKLLKSLLHFAALNGYEKLVLALLEKDINIDRKDHVSWTSLHYAANKGHVKVVEILLAKSASVNIANVEGSTALHQAAMCGHENVAKTLCINYKAQIDAKTLNDWSPLHCAVNDGKKNVFKFLVNKGANVNATTRNGISPLHMAVGKNFNDSKDYVEALLENNANVNMSDNNGKTALHCAAMIGNCEIANLLLNSGAKIKIADKNNLTPLYLAASGKNLHMIELFLLNADVHEWNNMLDKDNNCTPLHWAVKYDYYDIVNTLLNKNAAVDAKNKDGNTPLHVAVRIGNLKMVEALLFHNADVTARNNHDTVLHGAVNANHEKILLLILNKMKEKLKNDCDELFIAINAMDTEGNTPLMSAAKIGNDTAAQTLINFGVDINLQNSLGMTALHWSVLNCHKNVVLALITSENLDINIEDDNKQTPLHLALEKSNNSNEKYQTIARLLRAGLARN